MIRGSSCCVLMRVRTADASTAMPREVARAKFKFGDGVVFLESGNWES
jgi:hypothetical protein